MTTPVKIGLGVVGTIVLFVLVYFFFLRTTPQTSAPADTTAFATANNISTNVNNTAVTNTTESLGNSQINKQKIFKIADGPVTGATFVQFTRPTTTLVRFVMADNGHVFDMTIDSPGAVAHTVSNTTIPGSVQSIWSQNGKAVILQYFDNATIKTLSMTFPSATTTSATLQPARIKFFPDNISSIALSPDGAQAVYILKNSTGVDGYVSNPDGSSSKKLFTLALSQILLSWPSQNTLLLQTKSASGVPGIVFSVDARKGTIVPLIYAPGITAIADTSFSHIIYQTILDAATAPLTFSHTVKNATDKPISFTILPERCVWAISPNTLYCATPVQYSQNDYIGAWYQGIANVADDIVSVDTATGRGVTVGIPGSDDGGQQTSISQIQVSTDGHYLLYITKGDRSLWGVRLTQ